VTRKTWLQIVAFPLAALVLGFATDTLFPDGFTPDEQPDAESEFARITWKETEPRVQAGEWLLVDAREEEHYAARHIPGAVSLPVNAYPEMLEFFADEHGTTTTVVVYCGTEDCDMSTELAMRLRDEAGFGDIRILDGGFLAWQREH
jgi:rhodanese-related sulfurtransferase